MENPSSGHPVDLDYISKLLTQIVNWLDILRRPNSFMCTVALLSFRQSPSRSPNSVIWGLDISCGEQIHWTDWTDWAVGARMNSVEMDG